MLMEVQKSPTFKILVQNPIDKPYELEEDLERCYKKLNGQINNLSESQAHDLMNAQIAQGSKQHDEVQSGLLYTVLTVPALQSRRYRDMALTNRDTFANVTQKLNQLIYEKWPKVHDRVSKQILWLLAEFVKNRVVAAEGLVLNLLRNIAGGDISQKNIWLSENLLNIVSDVNFRVLLDKSGHLTSCVVYRFLRLLEDWNVPQLQTLRQRAASFCETILREKWQECSVIGRDLVRLLHSVGRLPEMERLWTDILYNPAALHPSFSGIPQLLQQRTGRKHIINLLTPEMENKICFLVTKVKFGNHKRYQDWFLKQFLSTPESQTLRGDLIRYICVAIHPTNEQLSSDIIPRWAVIGWLLSSCTSSPASSNAKLALFYDWLSYDPERDNIMNIEPGILVMYHSIRPHPQITATLLDFLCRIIPNYYQPMVDGIKQGVCRAFRTIMEKKVVPSLSPLFDNPKLDGDLQLMIRETFTEFCVREDVSGMNGRREPVIDAGLRPRESVSAVSDIAEFSDAEESETENGVEDTDEVAILLANLRQELGLATRVIDSPTPPDDISRHIAQLDGDIKKYVLDLQAESDRAAQCEVLDLLVQRLIHYDYNVPATAACLAAILHGDFNETLYPGTMDEEALDDSLGQPLFVIFRTLCQLSSEDPNRQTLLLLLDELQKQQPKIGVYLLYFLRVSKGTDDRITVYKEFSQATTRGSLKQQLISDIKVCRDSDIKLLTFLLPELYSQFSSVMQGNVEILYLILSSVDGAQLRNMISDILQGNMIMFVKDSLIAILNASLEWETLEQHFLWQLIAAHNLSADLIMPLLPRLDWSVHSEALSNLLVQLTVETPTQDLLRALLCRPSRMADHLTVSIIKFWASEHEDKLSEQLSSLLLRAAGLNRKRKGQQEKEKTGPTVEQILSHLEHVRITCKNASFLTNETLQHALSQIQSACSDIIKTRFSELLALAEDDEEEAGNARSSGSNHRAGRTLRGLPSRKAIAAEKAMSNKSKSSGSRRGVDNSDSSSDEDVIPRKRKKGQPTVEDDSD